MKTFLWLILFPPVGIYLLLKGKKNNPSERTETPPAEKPNTVKTEKKSEEQFTEPIYWFIAAAIVLYIKRDDWISWFQ